MSDLISRQAAIDAIEKLISARLDWRSDSSGERQGLNAAMCAIEDLPSAQPSTQLIAESKVSKEDMSELLAEKVEAIKAELVQPKTGRWIFKRPPDDWIMSIYECDQCHCWEEGRTNYCPNCGAKMDGET